MLLFVGQAQRVKGTRTKDGTCASFFPLKVRRVSVFVLSEISPLKYKRKIQKNEKKRKVNFVILMTKFRHFSKIKINLN